MSKRMDAMDKLGEALNDVKGVWTPSVREAYEKASKQFRNAKTRAKSRDTFKKAVDETYSPLIAAVYLKLCLDLPEIFDKSKEMSKVLARIEELKIGSSLK